MKLISMTQRVLNQMNTYNNACYVDDEPALNQLKEDLVKYNLELTPTAEKQIGL